MFLLVCHISNVSYTHNNFFISSEIDSTVWKKTKKPTVQIAPNLVKQCIRERNLGRKQFKIFSLINTELLLNTVNLITNTELFLNIV